MDRRVETASTNEEEEAVPMAAFVGVAWLEQLPPGKAMTVTIGDNNIALFNVDGHYCPVN